MSRTKRQGDLAETAFLARATEMGFRVGRMYGEDSRYDSVLDNGKALARVQVKSTEFLCRKNVYEVKAGRQECLGGGRTPRMVPYTKKEVDFLAACVLPERSFHFVPAEDLRGQKTLSLYSVDHKNKGPWGKYREAWDLLREWKG